MFPVKGLSISAEKLKVEGQVPTATTTVTPTSKPATSGSAKKRKRQNNTENVTAANLAELWEKVIEHKAPSGASDKADAKKNKRQKQSHEPAAAGQHEGKEKKQDKKDKKDKKKAELSSSGAPPSNPTEDEADEWNGIDEDVQQPDQEQADKKKKKKEKKQKHGDGSKEDVKPQQPADQKPKSKTTTPAPAPPAPAAPKLTPLQASMREKLISARFRHLNETLYTRPSAEAFQLFQDSPEMFTEYHEGFRRQVDVWPENPVDTYIADIKARAKVRFPPRQRNPNQPLTVTPSQLPLPKPMGAKTCTIADLGCGDAKLAAALQPLAQKLRLDLHSFDLQTGGSPLVTRADVANLPLPDGSVDVAIFCLALMGTNWLDFVEEAYRVLRWRGELWVAEIKSRFAGPGQQANKKGGGAAGGGGGSVVAHSVGHRRKGATPLNVNASKKKRQEDAAAAEAEDEAELAVQVDGAESAAARNRGQETDIAAFVEALRKRGFLLNRDLGEAAVDMGNKMFVRMHFVKAAPAVKGKCAVEEKGQGQGQQGHGQGQRHGAQGMRGKGGAGQAMMKKKFIGDDEGEGGGANEAAVLKPCVYKIR